MSSGTQGSLNYSIIERVLGRLLKTSFEWLLALLFVHIPSLIYFAIGSKKFSEERKKQRRIRSKITDESDPSSPYRALKSFDKLETQPEEQVNTLADIPRLCLERFADRETMGSRPITDVQQVKQANGKVFRQFSFGEYKFSTYREICGRIDDIGCGLLSLGAVPGDKILIYSETRPEWLCAAFAGFKHNLTVVTLIPGLDEQSILHGIQETKVKIIVASQELLPKLNKMIDKFDEVQYIVYFPARASTDANNQIESERIELISLDKLQEKGKTTQIDDDLLNVRPTKEDIAVIMYTSGSTGLPKGVIIRHENIIAAMVGQIERLQPVIDVKNDIFIGYLPLSHIFELCCEIFIFYLGVKSGYGTAQTLASESTAVQKGQKGDLQALRPHLMNGVPIIFERMHQAIYGEIQRSNICIRLMFNLCLTIKRIRLEHGAPTPILDRLVLSRFNKIVFGGRVKAILSGGAILAEETQRFLQCALGVRVLQGYGLTETCAGGTISDHHDIHIGRTGHPIISAEIRLINWEEGQYRMTDKPNPRGEVLIGGKIIADSYFGHATKENYNFKEIDGTKYFYTGDIGEIFPDGTIKIIDRKKDVVKIQNGEYVSLATVEMTIKKLIIVSNCCVCASDKYNHTIALISPNTREIASFAKEQFNQDDWKTLADDPNFNNAVLQQVQEVCRNNDLISYTIPKYVKVVTEPWSPETGLANDALKLKRKAIHQKYERQIQQLYEGNINQQQKKKEQ